MSSVYLLDTNIFVEAYKRYYAFDIAPSFWTALKSKAELGYVRSIDRVYDEINSYGEDDQLKIWVNNEFETEWFISTDNEVILEAYSDIINWVFGQAQFKEAAKAEFATVADGWLLACAKANSQIIVTHESFNRDVRKRVPIPVVCEQFNIPYINTFDMLRRLNVRLG